MADAEDQIKNLNLDEDNDEGTTSDDGRTMAFSLVPVQDSMVSFN